jgi:hypothetical protein
MTLVRSSTPFKFIARRIAKVVRFYTRRCFWAEPDELAQQGWLVALEALQTYDPSRMGEQTSLAGYIWNSLRFGIGAYLWKLSAPVSGRSLAELQRVDLRELEMLEADEDQPFIEEELDRLRREALVKEIVSGLVDARPDLAPGFDVFMKGDPPRVVAAKRGMSSQQVYLSENRVRRELLELADHALLWQLWAEA